MSNRNNQVILARNINTSPDYCHVVDLGTQGMIDLCITNAVYIGSDFSFVRAFDNKVKVQIDYNTAEKASYICIRDNSLTTEAEFGWIDKITYISDGCVEITYTVDLWSTWRDRIVFNRCLIERQHTQNDVFGANRQCEPIQIDSYVTNHTQDVDMNPNRLRAQFSENRTGENTYISPAIADFDTEGIPHTLYEMDAPLTTQALLDFQRHYWGYVAEGHGGSLLNVLLYHTTGESQLIRIPHQTQLNGYTPRNKKTLQSPFCLTKISNNFGQVNFLKPELFAQNEAVFQSLSVCSGIAQTSLRPKYYAGMDDSWDNSLSISDYPQLPVALDSYMTWMGQNKVLSEQAAGRAAQNGVLAAIGSLLGGGGVADAVMAGAGSFLSAGQIMYAYYNHPDNAPDTIVGRATGAYLNYASRKYAFTIEQQSIPNSRARAVDDYFSRYGYAVQEVDQVRTSNPYFNFHFVKVGGGECAIEGAMPKDALTTLNGAFRRGITIHQTNTMSCNFDA